MNMTLREVEGQRIGWKMRSRKLSDKDIIEIRELAAGGTTIAHLAKKFEVDGRTIRCHIDENYKKAKEEKEQLQDLSRWDRSFSLEPLNFDNLKF